MPHRLFDLREAAEYLHMPVSEIEPLVKRAEVPFELKGERVVFRRKDLDAWASKRILGSTRKGLDAYHRGSSAKVHRLSRGAAIVSELVRPGSIGPVLTSKTKPSILRDMAALAAGTGLVCAPEELLESLRDREEMCSTALAEGVALLHPRHHDPYAFEDSFVALGRSAQPIHFGAEDGRPTDLFFLICCQDDRIHLHVLARVCVMCLSTSLPAELREAPDAAAMEAALARSEREVIESLGGRPRGG